MSGGEFLARARTEAERYGPDPWVFARELLQNARDAGASRIDIDAGLSEGSLNIRFRDDGEGMSWEQAQRYLFSLYSSSKEDQEDQIGRFGVGFWSVLRLDPVRIRIQSQAEGAAPWCIDLEPASESAQRTTPHASTRGTCVELWCQGRNELDRARLDQAVRQNARAIPRRGQRGPRAERIQLYLFGERIDRSLELPAPSRSFGRGRAFGSVALERRARVELFSGGLRVRSASTLAQLVDNEGSTTHSRVAFSELAQGLAPAASLECAELSLLLNRSEARDTGRLKALVHRAEKETEQLLREELQRLRPPSLLGEFGASIRALFRRIAGRSTWRQTVFGALSGGLVALLIAPAVYSLARDQSSPIEGRVSASETPGLQQLRDWWEGSGERSLPLGDLSQDYGGPEVSPLDWRRTRRVDLRYRWLQDDKADPLVPLALRVLALDPRALDRTQRNPDPGWEPIQGAAAPPCVGDCIEIELAVRPSQRLQSLPRPQAIPIPTGYRLHADSLRLDGNQAQAWQSERGELGVLVSQSGRLRFVVAPGVDPPPSEESDPGLAPSAEALLPLLDRVAVALAHLPPEERVARAEAWVAKRIAYDTSAGTGEAHRQARRAGEGLLARSLRIGRGDCDIQNAVLAALLQATGLEARLAVGFVGQQGRPGPWMHAWVEWRARPEGVEGLEAKGRASSPWSRADASSSLSAPPGDEPSSAPSLPATPPPASDTLAANLPRSAAPPEHPPSDQGTKRNSLPVAATGEPSMAHEVLERWLRPPGWVLGTELEPGLRLAATLAWAVVKAGLLLALLAVLATTLGGAARRTWRRWRHGPSTDEEREAALAELLGGALAKPGLFQGLPEVFDRRLVPMLAGHASLRELQDEARKGSLYAGRKSESISRQAARRSRVVDLNSAAGRSVAGALGAHDLGPTQVAWTRARGERPTWLRELESQLRRWPGRPLLCLSPGPRDLEVHDLRPLAGRRTDRRVLVELRVDDPRAAAMEDAPARAFAVAFGVATALELEAHEVQEVLGRLARADLRAGEESV